MAWGLSYRLSEFLLFWKNPDAIKNIKPFFIGIFLFAWVGAKVTFLLASSKNNFSEYALSSNFWLGGGFVFYGGFLGGAFFSIVNARFFKGLSLKDIAIMIPSLCFAHAVGRIGCFLAGCCYGISSDSLLSVSMHGAHRHPVQLYETIALFVLGIALVKMLKNNAEKILILKSYVMGYALIRFGLEFLRGDKVRGIYFAGLSTSQIISIALIALMLITILYQKIKNQD